MSRGFCAFIVLLAAATASTPEAVGQIVDHNAFASVSVVGSQTVRLTVGEASGVPLSVRYVDSDGHPLAGLAVTFLVDDCSASGIGPADCPPQSTFGHFVPPMTAPAVTDGDGVAISHPFAAGSVVADYQVAAIAYSIEPANARLQGDSMGVFFHVEQLPQVSTVPITAGFTGAWYDPSQSGHGLLIEVLPSSRILAFWFTFDPDGQPAWFGGDGQIDHDVAFIHATQGAGGRWIPNFDPAAHQLFPWGDLTLTFSDCNHGRIDFAGNGDSSIWGVGHMDLTRLTSPAGIDCQ
jgi:hypothetical protein